MIVVIGIIAILYIVCMFSVSVHKETTNDEAPLFLIMVGLGLICAAICFK